jgi:hypothetical protein
MVNQMENRKGFVALLLGLALLVIGIGAVMAVSTEPNHARMWIKHDGDRATIDVGDCIKLKLEVRFKGTSNYVDVTHSPNTTYFTDPAIGSITGNEFCATSNTENKTFPIYGRYTDPVTKVGVTDTVIVTVRPD